MMERIISYIAQGFGTEKICEMVGCTPSYIEEVKQHSDFDTIYKRSQRQLLKLKEAEETEDKYDALERSTLSAVKDNLPFAEFRDLTKLMEMMIRRKQQAAPITAASITFNQTNNTVMLSIPHAAAPEIVLNNQKEVIAIGNRSLAPMQASGVRQLFSDIEKKRKSEAMTYDATKGVPDDF